jgi:hypothetical protein
MSRRTHALLSILAGACLYAALHWVWRDSSQPPRLLFGWLPLELARRLAWMTAAWLFLLHLTCRVWQEEEPS